MVVRRGSFLFHPKINANFSWRYIAKIVEQNKKTLPRHLHRHKYSLRSIAIAVSHYPLAKNIKSSSYCHLLIIYSNRNISMANYERQKRRHNRKNISVLGEMTPPRDHKNRSRTVPSSPSNQSILSAASYEKATIKKSPARIRVPPSSSYESEIGSISRQIRELPNFDEPEHEEAEITEFNPNLEYDCKRLAIAQKLILRMFLDENSSDVKFIVSGDLNDDDETEEAPPQIFHSHRFILEECAPSLADLCESDENCDGSHAIVPIDDMNPEVFHRLLYHVYGGKITDWTGCAKDMVEVAEKYNLPQLKLEAEDAYTQNAVITMDNLLYHILYADTRNCASLKDAVIDFIVDNEEEVSDKISVSADESSRALVWYW